MFPNIQDMFNPANANQMMQSMQKMWSTDSAEQQAETIKKLTGIWSETFTSCYEQNMKMAQDAMQTSVECMKDMSSAKGMEDMMAKQAEWTKKCSETCQSSAQNLAKTVQKGSQQAIETITKAMSSTVKASSSTSSKN